MPPEPPKDTRRILSVSEIIHDIKIVLESTLGEVWVEGEISNFHAHTSGHLYFTLKDNQAVLPAAMFARANKDLRFKLENGLKVVCFGKISVYGPSGHYQIIVDKIEPKGIGSLQLALEQLKEKLEKEGLFAQERKRPIPYLPSKIGIVTSLQGAAIKDILKVLDRRFSDVQIILGPAQVQGEAAKEEISQAIMNFNSFNESLSPQEQIEVLIVGRGGGSIEDLWAFNEEIVARAIYHSRIPVISAVGHERDWTIADLVADLRAPTPSAAAEIVIPKKEDLKEKLDFFITGLRRSFLDTLSGIKQELEDFSRRLTLSAGHIRELNASQLEALLKKLSLLNPAVRILQHQIKINDLARQVYVRASHFLQLRQAEFNTSVEKLSSLSPLNILGRGYSITFQMPQGTILKEAKLLKPGDALKTKLHKGEVFSRVLEVKTNG